MTTTRTVAILFGGIGGFSSGIMRSKVESYGKVYNWRVLCSIDFDAIACNNHDIITGEQTAVQMDLFSRDQYIKWFGHEPPSEWKEVTPLDVWKAFGEQVPDYIFLSPPCKGYSGLLPSKSAASDKYQALNQLTIRGLELCLEACLLYGDGQLPAFIHFENVPRITSRGKGILKQIGKLLRRFEYAYDIRTDHNLGEIGGLGQNRLRFLLLARNEARVPNFCYLPPKKKLKTIGDIIGPLPMPGDTDAGGPLNRLQRLQRKTWERLAAIPAGKDWSALKDFKYEKYRLQHEPRGGAWAVEDWNEPSRTVTGSAGVGRSNGATAISDPRVNFKPGTHASIYRMVEWDETGPVVTGAMGPSNGAICISDPKLNERDGRHANVYRIVPFEETAPCVTGTRLGSGAIAITDPRLGCKPRSGSYGVMDWNEPANTIIGSLDVHAGTAAVADPRIPEPNENCIMIIIAPDGTWHRPLTTYENAMLQGFDTHLPDGRPFQLEGCTDAKAREYIGNAVPPPSAEEMGNVILIAIAAAEADIMFEMSWQDVWVTPKEERLPAEVH